MSRKNTLKKAFDKSKNPGEKRRYQALWLLTQGYKRSEAAKINNCSKSAIGCWITKYNKQGLKGLKNKPQPGNRRKLTEKERKKINKIIKKNRPGDLGHRGKIWSIYSLKELIWKKFKITYSSNESYRKILRKS